MLWILVGMALSALATFILSLMISKAPDTAAIITLVEIVVSVSALFIFRQIHYSRLAPVSQPQNTAKSPEVTVTASLGHWSVRQKDFCIGFPDPTLSWYVYLDICNTGVQTIRHIFADVVALDHAGQQIGQKLTIKTDGPVLPLTCRTFLKQAHPWRSLQIHRIVLLRTTVIFEDRSQQTIADETVV